MQERDDATKVPPHGSLWSQGLRLAEAEIGRGPAPAGRWARPFGTAEGWSRETAPSESGGFGAVEESRAARAA